jgi:hypothetical protein
MIYVASKIPNKNIHRYVKKPCLIKKNVNKWIKNNNDIIFDATIEEVNDIIINNYYYIKTYPSLFLSIYFILLLITIIF